MIFIKNDDIFHLIFGKLKNDDIKIDIVIFLYIKNNKIRRGFLWMKKRKPKCKLIGENGNIFNLMGIGSRTLKRNGLKEESEEMIKRIEELYSFL